MKQSLPFVSNSDDDLHCLQAAYLMILKYFKPDTNISWDEWSKITGFEEGRGTWASAGLLWFHDNGFDVKHLELFDYEDFLKNGGDYLKKLTGDEIGQWQIEHSNIPLEQQRAKILLEAGLVERREPTVEDIKNFMADGYLVRLLINANKLNGKKGYFGHAITITKCDDNTVTFHDPGLPPIPNRKITWSELEAAWADPNKESKELDAIKLVI